jgi:nucleotide-binding universal stress UspA family protein
MMFPPDPADTTLASPSTPTPTSHEKLKIVVPTNFSKKSEMALDFALMYSRFADADVYVFHAVEKKITDYRELDRRNVEHMERMKQAVLQACERMEKRGIKHSVEDVHRRFSHGKAAVEVLRIAAGISADMIVMGKPSNKHFKALVEKAPCTLVLTRDKDAEFVM